MISEIEGERRAGREDGGGGGTHREDPDSRVEEEAREFLFRLCGETEDLVLELRALFFRIRLPLPENGVEEEKEEWTERERREGRSRRLSSLPSFPFPGRSNSQEQCTAEDGERMILRSSLCGSCEEQETCLGNDRVPGLSSLTLQQELFCRSTDLRIVGLKTDDTRQRMDRWMDGWMHDDHGQGVGRISSGQKKKEADWSTTDRGHSHRGTLDLLGQGRWIHRIVGHHCRCFRSPDTEFMEIPNEGRRRGVASPQCVLQPRVVRPMESGSIWNGRAEHPSPNDDP